MAAEFEQQPRGTLVHEVNLADQPAGREAAEPWSGDMARVDHYEFGRIVVDGHQETNDLIILPNRVVRNWWRQGTRWWSTTFARSWTSFLPS